MADTLTKPSVAVRIVRPDRIYPLRHRVLREGLPFESARFDGDDEEDTLHLAAFLRAGGEEPLACASFMLRNYRDGEPSWQLRGMATAPEYRGTGIGSDVLRTGERMLKSTSPPSLVWMNARVVALPFYSRHGYIVASEEFEIDGAGPHRVMKKRL